MRRNKQIPLKELFANRPIQLSYLKPSDNGCLIYCNPHKSKSDKPPLIGLNGGKTTTTLRYWIWEQHNGPVPYGLHIHMSCNNNSCFSYSHMYLSSSYPKYALKKPKYIFQYSKQQIYTVVYFHDKLQPNIISQIMGLSPYIVAVIIKDYRSGKIKYPNDWAPSKVIFLKAENIALSHGIIYLSPNSQSEAKDDIERAGIPFVHKQILIGIISGERVTELSRKLGFSMGGIYYIYRRSLANVYTKNGFSDWMYFASKGVITQ